MPARRDIVVLILLLAVLGQGGCAAMQPGYDPALGKVQEKPNIDLGRMDGETYQLSNTEKTFDCKKLLGSMQITIARLKDQAERPPPSSFSTTMKGTMAPLFGGSTYNTDPQAEIARDKAKLHAYNRALGEKGCAKLDVEAELAKAPEGPKRY